MHKTKRIVVFIFLILFFLMAFFSVISVAKHDIEIFRKLHGLTNEQKRKILVGDLYELIEKSSLQIPEESNVLLLTDNANEGLMLSYHLYPRKLFFNNVEPIRQEPGNLDDLDEEWMKSKKISWIILRFSKILKLNKVVRSED